MKVCRQDGFRLELKKEEFTEIIIQVLPFIVIFAYAKY